MMWESSLANPYVMDPLLETMGLRGVPALWIFREAIELGGDCTGGIELFVFLGG